MAKKRDDFKDLNWFMTITYKKKHHKDPQQQFKRTALGLAKRLASATNFSMYPEFTSKGCIHYHIIFSGKNKIRYHKELIPYIDTYCGYYDIQKVKDYGNVLEYCVKDQPAVEHILQYFKLPITNDNYKDLKKYKTDREREDKDDYLFESLDGYGLVSDSEAKQSE